MIPRLLRTLRHHLTDRLRPASPSPTTMMTPTMMTAAVIATATATAVPMTTPLAASTTTIRSKHSSSSSSSVTSHPAVSSVLALEHRRVPRDGLNHRSAIGRRSPLEADE